MSDFSTLPKSRPRNSRRRSLKALLQLPPSFSPTKTPAHARPDKEADNDADSDSSRTQAVCRDHAKPKSVPFDIIVTIAELLCPGDVLSFSLASSAIRHLLLPTLYTSVVLKSSQKCFRTLLMLLAHPDICSYIRKLAVRPNYYLSWPRRDGHLDEDWVADMIARIAPSLVLLNWFDWDGLEMPGDRLWEALRKSCPQLRNISTNLGTRLVHSGCKLFRFSNLTTFSIVVRHNLRGSDTTDTFPPVQRLPDEFWDMILHRCPELSELTICSFSPYTCSFDISPLLVPVLDSAKVSSDVDARPRFPKLTSLTLGSFGYLSDFTLGMPSDPLFGQFISTHPSLTTLRLLWTFRRWVSPDVVPLIVSPTLRPLPKLTTFIGIYQQLAEIPEEHRARIEVVDLTCEPVYEGRVRKVVDVLKTMSGLRCMEVWVHVGEGMGMGDDGEEEGRRVGDSGSSFGNLVGACPPGLEELHFMCTTPFTRKPFNQLLFALYGLPSLRRFSLTKGHQYWGDESMLSTAIRVVKGCKEVKTVNVRLAREGCVNHLKREGVYEVVRDENGGGGVVLSVHERGIPMVGRPSEKRYRKRVRL